MAADGSLTSTGTLQSNYWNLLRFDAAGTLSAHIGPDNTSGSLVDIGRGSGIKFLSDGNIANVGEIKVSG